MFLQQFGFKNGPQRTKVCSSSSYSFFSSSLVCLLCVWFSMWSEYESGGDQETIEGKLSLAIQQYMWSGKLSNESWHIHFACVNWVVLLFLPFFALEITKKIENFSSELVVEQSKPIIWTGNILNFNRCSHQFWKV